MRLIVCLSLALLYAPLAASTEATLYKTPDCDCCEGYADHLRANSIAVTVVPTENLSQMHREHDVPPELDGCHLTMTDGYVVEGHVPINALKRLLKERPAINGLSLPGDAGGLAGHERTQTRTVHDPRDRQRPGRAAEGVLGRITDGSR